MGDVTSHDEMLANVVCKLDDAIKIQAKKFDLSIEDIRIVLVNFFGNRVLHMTNGAVITNYKKSSEMMMSMLEEYFEFAIPLAIEEKLAASEQKTRGSNDKQ